jgi:anti-anti-sigma regulatory factor
MSAQQTPNDEPIFVLHDGVLEVQRDLRQDFDLSFDRACSELLSSEKDELLIDLTRATYVNSTYIGMIAATFFQAQAVKKSLTIRALPDRKSVV